MDAARIREVYRALSLLYPDAHSGLLEPSRGNALDVLVKTILSQATNDTLSSRAFDALREAYPTWDKVLSADPGKVEKALATGGLQREKTKKLQATLQKIRDDFGRITLAPLEGWPLAEAYSYLSSLPGVGPKTAACVIGFGLCKPAFPVDTHVLRISRRLGLIPPKSTAPKAQELLSAVVPPEIQMPLHVMMIRHGRDMCHSRRPDCGSCPLRVGCTAPGPQ